MSNAVSGLSSTYQSIISSMMTIERQPLTLLQTQQDTLKVQRGVFTDFKGQLDVLQTSVRSMISTNAEYSFSPGRTVAVASQTSGKTVASATVSSTSIPAGYQLSVTKLAKEHRVSSYIQAYSNQELGYNGTISIGGASTRSASDQVTNPAVASMTAVEPAIGQKELGSGQYYVETRKSGEIWQFRLVNSEGTAFSISKNDGANGYSSDWQAIPTGEESTVELDTGRGIKLTFNTDDTTYTAGLKGQIGTAGFKFAAKGAQVSINKTDSLIDIAYNINHAAYADGNEVTATVINNKLVLASKNSGTAHKLVMADNTYVEEGVTKQYSVLKDLGIYDSAVPANGGYLNKLQDPDDAVFTINDIEVTTSKNEGLTNVIQGLTLNLAADAQGNSASINVASNLSTSTDKINAFINNFNSLDTYLNGKLAVVKQADGKYKRGSLSGDMMVQNLRAGLFGLINTSLPNGAFKNLMDVGISLEDGKIKLSNSAKLQTALNEDFSGVQALMDKVMTAFDNKLSQYTGTSAYVTQQLKSTDQQTEYLTTRISAMDIRLTAKQAYLTQQFAEMQVQLQSLEYQQEAIAAGMSSLMSI